MNILVACGPFTTADNLLYEPLSDLLKVILNQEPDVAILVIFQDLYFVMDYLITKH